MYPIMRLIKQLTYLIVESSEIKLFLLINIPLFILILLMFFIICKILYFIYEHFTYIYTWCIFQSVYVIITIGIIYSSIIFLFSPMVILAILMTINNPDVIITNYYAFMINLDESLSSYTVSKIEFIENKFTNTNKLYEYDQQVFLPLFNTYYPLDTLEPVIVDKPITTNKVEPVNVLTVCPVSGNKISTISHNSTTTAYFPLPCPNYTYLNSISCPEPPANSHHLRLPPLPKLFCTAGMLDDKEVELPDINILRGYDESPLRLSPNDLKLRVMWDSDLQTYTNKNNVSIERTSYGWRADQDKSKYIMVDGFSDGAKKLVLYDKSHIQDALRAKVADSLRDLQSQGCNYLDDSNIPVGMRNYCFNMFRNNGIPIPSINGRQSFTGIPINDMLFRCIERAQP